jgi:hypothetical protein
MTTITWDILERPADPERERLDRAYGIDEAWAAWQKYCCVERNGAHLWLAELDTVEEGGDVSLTCQQCPASVDDLCPDGADAVVGDVDGIPVEFGRSRTLTHYAAPVHAALRVEHYPANPAHGDEWDVWIEIESRPVAA